MHYYNVECIILQYLRKYERVDFFYWQAQVENIDQIIIHFCPKKIFFKLVQKASSFAKEQTCYYTQQSIPSIKFFYRANLFDILLPVIRLD